MLEQNIVKYQDLKLPCYTEVNKNALNSLEGEIKKAFSAGFEEINKVPEIFLFRWTVKLVCGILYHDIIYALKRQNTKGQKFTISPRLTTKFKILHFMLQSLVLPMKFKGTKPLIITFCQCVFMRGFFNEFIVYVLLHIEVLNSVKKLLNRKFYLTFS